LSEDRHPNDVYASFPYGLAQVLLGCMDASSDTIKHIKLHRKGQWRHGKMCSAFVTFDSMEAYAVT